MNMEKWRELRASIKAILIEYGLEALLFVITLGSADVIYQYLTSTGSKDTTQLRMAVYAVEMLIVWASLWGGIGLLISFALFLINLISIHSVYGQHWLGHTLFSVAVFLGSVGNYTRRVGWNEVRWLIETYRSIKRKGTETIAVVQATNPLATVLSLSGLSVADIRKQFNLSLAAANVVKAKVDSGLEVTEEWIKSL
jgi:hypothetical protein